MDIETTGLDLHHDNILSIGVVQITRGRVMADTFYSLCRPECAISPEAMKFHCLTTEEIATAPTRHAAMEQAATYLRDHVLVAHAAWIERAFIDRALATFGQRLPRGIVDTAALARQAGFDAPPGREPSLEGLARSLQVPVHTPHHALGDAATTAFVLLAQINHLEGREGVVTVERLLEITRQHRR